MSNYFDAFKIECSPCTKPENTFTVKNIRFSVITDRLLRVEVSVNGVFCDEPTQAVWHRDFGNPEYTEEVTDSRVIIKTCEVEYCYNISLHKMLSIKLSDGRLVTDFKAGNLKGTCRTLDRTFGKTKIGDGIISKNGVATLLDGKSLVINDQAQIVPREADENDTYYFAYGNDYKGALKDFFSLTGNAPLVPRFTLGNWWSRYKAYTQQEYIALMESFINKEIPITVATVDMDWHWVGVEEKFGKQAAKNAYHNNLMEYIYDIIFKGGWTGYSWNTDLFPNPEGFLKWLKDNNFKVTLNLHPATGVRFFEDSYSEFARFMGDDPAEKKQYAFDITDKKFVEGYFDILHKPHQDMGVDFWWIDWQQGSKTKTKGLDPLWALNHYHSMDIARNGERRPLILSRFARAGSHRYPLGFSGDTAQNWQVLDFQPYFTSTAANIGYTWWSHDIGGHHYGKKDDELYLRWVQFGVFSPIMRLHSTSNEFMGKEPWNYSATTNMLATDFLRLRHRLLPYTYTMNYRTSTEGRAICEPMYYEYPDKQEAYDCKNEYHFGSELIAAPITSKKSKSTNLAGTEVWVPEGRYTDIFTGNIYNGPATIKMFRDESSIPVLAKAGAIIPLDMNDKTNICKNPENMELLIYRGNNEFSLYEDDGETMQYKNGKLAFTDFCVCENGDTVAFTVKKARGDISVLPEKRSYKLSFRDITDGNISVSVNSCEASYDSDKKDGFVCVKLENISPCDEVSVVISNVKVKQNENKRDALIRLISKYQMSNNSKQKLYGDYVNGKKPMPSVKACYRQPLMEIESMF